MTTLVFEELRAAVEATAPDRLATVASAMAQAYGAGGLTDEQYETLDGLLAARRRLVQAVPHKALTLATACAQLVTAAAPAPAGQGTASTRPHHHTGSRPRSAESAARRRRWAAAGYLPPRLAAAFTPGEQAVLAVIAMEIGKRGTCTLAIGHMAALAGVFGTVAKRALRQAQFAGYNRSGGENAARLATTQAYANSFAGGQTLPGVSAPRGGSMGSTAQAGGFGLNGIVGQGAAVPGQASPTPGVASLSGQPLTAVPESTGFSSDPAATQQPASPYSAIGNALRGIGGGQQRPSRGQGQQKSGGMKLGQPYKPQTIGLQQAQAMFDPGRFYGVLRNAGVRGV